MTATPRYAPDELVTLAEAARLVGLTRTAAYKAFPAAARVVVGGRVFVPRAAALAYRDAPRHRGGRPRKHTGNLDVMATNA